MRLLLLVGCQVLGLALALAGPGAAQQQVQGQEPLLLVGAEVLQLAAPVRVLLAP